MSSDGASRTLQYSHQPSKLGWFSVPSLPIPLLPHVCKQEDTLCSQISSVVLVMLSLCRRECRDFYSNQPESHLDWDILDYGGLKDLLPQPFGFQLPVCSLREGYHHAQMVAKQVKVAPWLCGVLSVLWVVYARVGRR